LRKVSQSPCFSDQKICGTTRKKTNWRIFLARY